MFIGISNAVTRGENVWGPLGLFANGEAGAWYDPSDLTTLWTDTGGTTAATSGDDVARIDDLSGNGNNATQATAGLRMTYLEAGGYRYLSGNGTDDTYIVTLPDLGTDATAAYCDETGVTILENQTISGAYSLPLVNKLAEIVILDRAMTAAEKARVTAYFTPKIPRIYKTGDGDLILPFSDGSTFSDGSGFAYVA